MTTLPLLTDVLSELVVFYMLSRAPNNLFILLQANNQQQHAGDLDLQHCPSVPARQAL